MAQNETVKPGTDTQMINQLIAAAMKQKDPDSSLRLCNKPLQMSIAGNYNYGCLETWDQIARNYSVKSDFVNCIMANRQSLSYAQKPTRRARYYLNIGGNYYSEGNYAAAVESFDSGLMELQKEQKVDTNGYLRIYNALAALNFEIKQDSNALYYFNKAEALARSAKNYRQLVVILNNKSNYYSDHKRLDSALRYLLEAKSIVEANDIRKEQSEIDVALASIYVDSGLYDQAIAYCKSATAPGKLQYDENPEPLTIYAGYTMANALYHLKKYKEAEAIIVPAIKKAEALDMQQNRVSAYTTLAGIYTATGQYKKALDCKDTVYALTQMLIGTENTGAINRMAIKYQTAEKDKQLVQNQLMIAQQSSKLARKNMWIVSIAGILLLMLVAAVIPYTRMLNRQRTVEKENKIKTLQAAVAGGDTERSRIARELHDGIGGMLSAAMMRFSSMHHESPEITNTAAYKEAMDTLREMGDEIRKTAHNLMPDVLMKQSLPEAVRIFCSSVQGGDQLKIDFQSYGSFDGLPENYKLNLYRIVQELVKNVITHARANKVLVQLLHNENKLVVSVEDNGIGFNVNEIKNGMGLHNVRTRAESLDGHYILESKPGKGTTVIIEFEADSLLQKRG